jgi:hypothetical protein
MRQPEMVFLTLLLPCLHLVQTLFIQLSVVFIVIIVYFCKPLFNVVIDVVTRDR